MPRLKSREKQIPNGFVYYVAQIPSWRPQAWSSLDSLADQVIQLRQGNPFLAQKHGWSTDKATVLEELDAFNANVCASMGWMNFIVGSEGTPPPNPRQAPSQSEISKLAAAGQKVKNLWAGLKTGSEWIDSGAPAVPAALSESRAQICAACPSNLDGDWTRWFTKPAATLIQRQVERLSERKLSTTKDDVLKLCDRCDCVMRVKVHAPIEFIQKHTPDATLDKLRAVPACWVPKEIAAS